MSQDLVNAFNQMPERNRLIRAMLLKIESKYAIISYARKPRTAGHSKFNFSSLLSLGWDGITSYSYIPLRIASSCGLIFSISSFLGLGWVLYEKLTYNRVPGWASIVVPLLFFSGIQLLFLGVIGEYIGKIYSEIKKRPLFLVRKKYIHNKNINYSDQENLISHMNLSN